MRVRLIVCGIVVTVVAFASTTRGSALSSVTSEPAASRAAPPPVRVGQEPDVSADRPGAPAERNAMQALLIFLAGPHPDEDSRRRAWRLLGSCGLEQDKADTVFWMAERFSESTRGAYAVFGATAAEEAAKQLLASLEVFLRTLLGDHAARQLKERCLPFLAGISAPDSPSGPAAPPPATSESAKGSLALATTESLEQSCGEAGGDYCSASGGCPAGYISLGETYDCNPCCLSQQSGPSCGEAGGDYCSQTGYCPSGYSSLGFTYDCTPCCKSEPPPPPPSGPGPECRVAGYSAASDSKSYVGHLIHIEAVSEQYRFWGANEGHDGRANLLQNGGLNAPSICNLPGGTCTGRDQGCPLGGLLWCSGRSGVDLTCAAGEYCLGMWSAVGHPVGLPPNSYNPFKKMDQRSYSEAFSFTPTDCDCTSSTGGRAGHYIAAAAPGQYRAAESIFGSIGGQTVADAGSIEAIGPPSIRNRLDIANVCISGGGVELGAVIISTTFVTP